MFHCKCLVDSVYGRVFRLATLVSDLFDCNLICFPIKYCNGFSQRENVSFNWPLRRFQGLESRRSCSLEKPKVSNLIMKSSDWKIIVCPHVSLESRGWILKLKLNNSGDFLRSSKVSCATRSEFSNQNRWTWACLGPEVWHHNYLGCKQNNGLKEKRFKGGILSRCGHLSKVQTASLVDLVYTAVMI